MRSKFEIYRPPVSKQRLEGEYYNPPPGVWTPSTTYKVPLDEIKIQLTPAQAYKLKLQTTGKITRLLQRLEWKWEKNYELWTSTTLRIQCFYRGYVGRKYYNTIKYDLFFKKKVRETNTNATNAYKNKQYDDVITIVDDLPIDKQGFRLQTMKLKSYYATHRYNECVTEAKKCYEIDTNCEDIHYLYVCSLMQLGRIEDAYAHLRYTNATLDELHSDFHKLDGLICMKMTPPKFYEALASFDHVVKKHPESMSALLFRANVYVCIQDWTNALADLDVIQKFQPNQPHVLHMRARVHACKRNWKEAKEDLTRIKNSSGASNEYYIDGLNDTEIHYDSLPMVDRNMLFEEDNS